MYVVCTQYIRLFLLHFLFYKIGEYRLFFSSIFGLHMTFGCAQLPCTFFSKTWRWIDLPRKPHLYCYNTFTFCWRRRWRAIQFQRIFVFIRDFRMILYLLLNKRSTALKMILLVLTRYVCKRSTLALFVASIVARTQP